MIYPEFIKRNSCIGVPAPSSGIEDEKKKRRIINAKKNMEDLGYKIILSDNIFINKKGRSASNTTRAKEINQMFANDNIDMMICAAGGDFLIEILPYIDFDFIKSFIPFTLFKAHIGM